MKSIVLIIMTAIPTFVTCQENKYPESCLENLIGKSIQVLVEDSTIHLRRVNEDSTEFRFLFGTGSHLPYVFAEKSSPGVPYMIVDVSNGSISSILFKFTNVGDVDPELPKVSRVFKEHFCIDRTLKVDSINRLWYDNYDVGEVNVDIKVLWDARKMDVIKIHYTKKE